MKSSFRKKLTRIAIKSRGFKNSKGNSSYSAAKTHREFLITSKRNLKDFIFITLGIFSAAFGLKGFLLPNNFIDGGATGLALLVAEISKIPLFSLIIYINIPFILLAYKVMGKTFALKTALAILGLSAVVATVTFPIITNDNLLVSIFGGMFLGAGIGLAIRGSAVIDGTEVLAIYLSRKFGLTIGDVIIAINVLIFGAAAYLLGVEIALYSMITYLAASKTLDFIVEGIDEYIGVTVVSSHSEEIRQMIISKIGLGVTIYNGKAGFNKTNSLRELDILYTIITRLEINRLTTEIKKIEPTAFIIMNSIRDVS
ncbi:MAG: YitT family protein, partial [Bacteroidota bacterium]